MQGFSLPVMLGIVDLIIEWGFLISYFVIGVVALNGMLYVVGGDDGTSNLASVEVYNPKSDSWSMLPSSMGIGRSYAGVCIIDKPM